MKANPAHLKLETLEAPRMKFSVRTGRHTFVLDNGQGSVAESPMEAVLGALGACAGMDVISILRKMRQDVTGYEIELNAERADEHPRVFTSIEIVHKVYGNDLQPAMVARAIELSETRYCSVHAMLKPTVRLTSRHELIPGRPAAA